MVIHAYVHPTCSSVGPEGSRRSVCAESRNPTPAHPVRGRIITEIVGHREVKYDVYGGETPRTRQEGQSGGWRLTMRILVAGDHAAMRQSLVQALEGEPEVEVVGEAPEGGAAVQLAKRFRRKHRLRTIFPLVPP